MFTLQTPGREFLLRVSYLEIYNEVSTTIQHVQIAWNILKYKNWEFLIYYMVLLEYDYVSFYFLLVV